MVRAMEQLRVRRMGVQVRWAPSSIFREMWPREQHCYGQKRRQWRWRFWRVQTCSVSARRFRFGERSKECWSFLGSRTEWDGTCSQWDHGRGAALNSYTGERRSTQEGQSTVEVSEAWESWKNNSRSWWRRHHGQNCDGTACDDLGQPSYGPPDVEGARCSWQGVGKPLQWGFTMPL